MVVSDNSPYCLLRKQLEGKLRSAGSIRVPVGQMAKTSMQSSYFSAQQSITN